VYATDGTGNVSQATEYKFGNTQILRRTVTAYHHQSNPAYATANMTNLPASVSIQDGYGTEVARTEYGYDDYSLTLYPGPVYNHDTAYDSQGITVRGNPTRVKNKLIQEGRFLTASSQYDMVGNVVSATDPKNNPPTTRTFSSATNYALPQYLTNALGHQSQQTWKQYTRNGYTYYNGDLASTIDPNGAQVQYWYDELGRTTQVTKPSGTKNMQYSDPQYQTSEISPTGTQEAQTDSSGDVLWARQSNPNGGYFTTSAYYDNPLRQPSIVSKPSGDSVSYSYDPMGRVTVANDYAIGITSTQFAGNTATVTNPENKQNAPHGPNGIKSCLAVSLLSPLSEKMAGHS
jgi:YD repeat-containing protein